MPVLSSRRLVRFGGISAMVGGALSVVLALLLVPEVYQPRLWAATPLLGGALDLAVVLGSVLISLGTLGLYATVVRRSPRLATLGVLLASLSAVVFAGAGLYHALFSMFIGYTEQAITPVWMSLAASVADLTGYLLLGAVLLRARTFGRLSALPLVLVLLPLAFTLLFPLFANSPVAAIMGTALMIQALSTVPTVLGNLGWVLVGYLLWYGKTSDADGSPRVA